MIIGDYEIIYWQKNIFPYWLVSSPFTKLLFLGQSTRWVETNNLRWLETHPN